MTFLPTLRASKDSKVTTLLGRVPKDACRVIGVNLCHSLGGFSFCSALILALHFDFQCCFFSRTETLRVACVMHINQHC